MQFDNAELTQVLGYVALVVILAEGGLTTTLGRIRLVGRRRPRCWPPSASWSRSPSSASRRTLLLDVSLDDRAAGRGGADLDRRGGGLLGAAPGAAAAPADRHARGRVRASTTPPSCILVVALSEPGAGPAPAPGGSLLLAALELAVGAAIGLASAGWAPGAAPASRCRRPACSRSP